MFMKTAKLLVASLALVMCMSLQQAHAQFVDLTSFNLGVNGNGAEAIVNINNTYSGTSSDPDRTFFLRMDFCNQDVNPLVAIQTTATYNITLPWNTQIDFPIALFSSLLGANLHVYIIYGWDGVLMGSFDLGTFFAGD